MNIPYHQTSAYPRESDLTQCHLSAVEVKEVHQFDRSPFFQGFIINSFRLVVELEHHRENLHVLCNIRLVYAGVRTSRTRTEVEFRFWRTSGRKRGLGDAE